MRCSSVGTFGALELEALLMLDEPYGAYHSSVSLAPPSLLPWQG